MDEFINAIADMLPDGWDCDADTFGWDFQLTCPHGNTIEQDGRGPCGCVSPLRALGLI